MARDELIERLRLAPEHVSSEGVVAFIKDRFDDTPAGFAVGPVDDRIVSAAGDNEGSCKISTFARLNGLTDAQTLACFGRYNRDAVPGHPDGTDHPNIGAFMRHGLDAAAFEKQPLVRRRAAV